MLRSNCLKERSQMRDDAVKQRQDAIDGGVWKRVIGNESLSQIRQSSEFRRLDASAQAAMDDAIGGFRSRDEADADLQKEKFGAYWELSSDPGKLGTMSEAEIYAAAPRLGPELTARLLDERKRLQNPDSLAETKLDAETLIRIARRAVLDTDLPEDRETLGALRHRAQEIFASEQRNERGQAAGLGKKRSDRKAGRGGGDRWACDGRRDSAY
jgi:hypothetical protein